MFCLDSNSKLIVSCRSKKKNWLQSAMILEGQMRRSTAEQASEILVPRVNCVPLIGYVHRSKSKTDIELDIQVWMCQFWPFVVV